MRKALTRWSRWIGDFEAKESENSFYMFNRQFKVGESTSVLRLLAGDARFDNARDVDDVFVDDPHFWQQPWRWWHHFAVQAEGSTFMGFRLYIHAMLWKIKSFMRLSLGIWDESMVENMQIKYRSSRFGVANEASFDTKHESLLISTGEAHSLFWLFLPYCAFLSKAGEFLNASHIFVRDDAVKSAIKQARARHHHFLADQEDRNIEPSDEDKYWWNTMDGSSPRIREQK